MCALTQMEMMKMIKCNGCGETKPETEFYVRPRNKTGYDTKCKKCLCEQERSRKQKTKDARQAKEQRRQRRADLHRQKDREYREKNRASLIAQSHAYAEKYPERRQAGLAVLRAVDRKEILPARKCKCADCGKRAAELHHESYEPDKWLAVVPLCHSCHRKRHMSSKV